VKSVAINKYCQKSSMNSIGCSNMNIYLNTSLTFFIPTYSLFSGDNFCIDFDTDYEHLPSSIELFWHSASVLYIRFSISNILLGQTHGSYFALCLFKLRLKF
jgi:hypothetical protein